MNREELYRAAELRVENMFKNDQKIQTLFYGNP